MTNKTIGYIIIFSIALSVLTALFETSLTVATQDNFYLLAWLIWFVFGTWGAVRLMK
jgi:hypothetical protein